MGLESPNQEPNSSFTKTLLSGTSDELFNQGWRRTDFGFNLGRQTGALDIIKGEERRLIYPTTQFDTEAYQKLLLAELPVFETALVPADVPDGFNTVTIPLSARALDSMEFPDTNLQPGFLGSFEIMTGVAELLARIYGKTGTLPKNLRLGQLALVVDQNKKDPCIIRLIPPLHLTQKAISIQSVSINLLKDLDNQDPMHDHQKQVEYFKNMFNDFLKYVEHRTA